MKLLMAAAALTIAMMIMFFAGMAGSSTGMVMFSFCSMSLFGNPLLWVAIYRVATQVSRKYQVVPRRG